MRTPWIRPGRIVSELSATSPERRWSPVVAVGERQPVLLVEPPPDKRPRADDPERTSAQGRRGNRRRERGSDDQGREDGLGEEADVADQDRCDQAPRRAPR